MSTVTNEHLRPAMLLAHGVPPRAAWLHEWKCNGAFHMWYINRGIHKHKIEDYNPDKRSTYAIQTSAWLAFHSWTENYILWLALQRSKARER